MRGRPFSKTHGLCNTRLYRVWAGMKQRCYNANKKYDLWRGRGIEVCPEWRDSFVNFYEWAMANGYAEGLSIDRIDNDGDYSPENCRWATWTQQANNRRSTMYATHNGETMPVPEWARRIGVKPSVLRERLERLSVKDALAPDSLRRQAHPSRRNISFCGEVYDLNEWAQILGIKRETLGHRMRTMSVEKAFFMPVQDKGPGKGRKSRRG